MYKMVYIYIAFVFFQKMLKKFNFDITNANVILLCAWNIVNEIVSQEKRFIEEGGKFIIPFPEPHFYKK